MSAKIVHAGLVHRIEAEHALIAVTTTGCSSCGHAGGCGIGKLAGNRRTTLIRLPRPSNLAIGDQVTLELDEAHVTRAAMLGYLLPAVLLIGGALTGEQVGGMTALGNDASAALGAVFGLATGLLLARWSRPLLPRLSHTHAI